MDKKKEFLIFIVLWIGIFIYTNFLSEFQYIDIRTINICLLGSFIGAGFYFYRKRN